MPGEAPSVPALAEAVNDPSVEAVYHSFPVPEEIPRDPSSAEADSFSSAVPEDVIGDPSV